MTMTLSATATILRPRPRQTLPSPRNRPPLRLRPRVHHQRRSSTTQSALRTSFLALWPLRLGGESPSGPKRQSIIIFFPIIIIWREGRTGWLPATFFRHPLPERVVKRLSQRSPLLLPPQLNLQLQRKPMNRNQPPQLNQLLPHHPKLDQFGKLEPSALSK